MGGSAAIVLARPNDGTLRAKVAALLARLRADPQMGIADVLDGATVAKMGGTARASFLVAFRSGYEPGRDPAAPKTRSSSYKGMHGYLPSEPAMRSSLFADGPALARHGDLGVIDMRSIAPSIAHMLGVRLAGAERPASF